MPNSHAAWLQKKDIDALQQRLAKAKADRDKAIRQYGQYHKTRDYLDKVLLCSRLPSVRISETESLWRPGVGNL